MRNTIKGLASKLGLASLLALGAGAMQEAKADDPDYTIRYSFKVKDAQGNETRDLVTGTTNTLEVLAEKVKSGSKPTSGLDFSFKYPEGIEFFTSLQLDLNYGEDDFFKGFQMFGPNYNGISVGNQGGQIKRYTSGITTTGEGPGEFAKGVIARADFKVTGKPGATNSTAGFFRISDALTYSGTVQDGQIQPRNQRSLLVALIPENATNTPAIFYDFNDGKTPANDGKIVFSPYVFSGGNLVNLEKTCDLGGQWSRVFTNGSDRNSFEFTDETSRNANFGFYRVIPQE
jgi:hypothetical protein